MRVELYHDILARKVYDKASPEERMRLRVERFVKDRYLYFQEEGVLLGKEDLNFISPHLDNLILQEAEAKFIRTSQLAIEKSARRKRRNVILIIAGLSILSVFALWQWQQARYQEKVAISQKLEADSLRGKAEDLADTLGEVNTKLIKKTSDAVAAAKLAMDNENIARNNAARAERAEQDAKNQRDQAQKKALAYRLMVMAVEQKSNSKLAFQIAKKASEVFPDPAVMDFLRTAFNNLDEKSRIVGRLDGGPLLKAWFTPNGRVFSVHKKEVNIWDVVTGSEKGHKITGNDIADADYRTNDQWIGVANGNQVDMYQAPYRQMHGALPHPSAVKQVRFIPHSDNLATVSADHSVRIWSVSRQQILHTIPNQTAVSALDIDPAGKNLAIACTNRWVKLMTNAGAARDSFRLETEISEVKFMPDGKIILLKLINYRIAIYDLAQKRIISTVGHKAPVMDIAVPQQGNWFLSASNDETVKRWRLSGQMAGEYSHYQDDETSIHLEKIALGPDEDRFLVATFLQEVVEWTLDGAMLDNHSFPDRIAALDYSPDQQFFLVGLRKGDLQVFHTYSYINNKTGSLNWADIDRLGLEMPLNYWLDEKNITLLRAYAGHFAKKSDNFKNPAQHAEVLAKSAKLYEKWLSLIPPGNLSAQDRETIATVYGNLSWYQLEARQFHSAIHSARKGIEMNPAKKWINTNLALGYVLTGQFSKARPIYMRLKDQIYDGEGNKERTFRQVFLQHLDDLKSQGISHPDLKKVREMLK